MWHNGNWRCWVIRDWLTDERCDFWGSWGCFKRLLFLIDRGYSSDGGSVDALWNEIERRSERLHRITQLTCVSISPSFFFLPFLLHDGYCVSLLLLELIVVCCVWDDGILLLEFGERERLSSLTCWFSSGVLSRWGICSGHERDELRDSELWFWGLMLGEILPFATFLSKLFWGTLLVILDEFDGVPLC